MYLCILNIHIGTHTLIPDSYPPVCQNYHLSSPTFIHALASNKLPILPLVTVQCIKHSEKNIPHKFLSSPHQINEYCMFLKIFSNFIYTHTFPNSDNLVIYNTKLEKFFYILRQEYLAGLY